MKARFELLGGVEFVRIETEPSNVIVRPVEPGDYERYSDAYADFKALAHEEGVIEQPSEPVLKAEQLSHESALEKADKALAKIAAVLKKPTKKK